MRASDASSGQITPLLPPPGSQWTTQRGAAADDAGDVAARLAVRRAGCLCATILLLAVSGLVAFLLNQHAVGLLFSKIADYVSSLSTPAEVAVLGGSIFFFSFFPGPFHPARE